MNFPQMILPTELVELLKLNIYHNEDGLAVIRSYLAKNQRFILFIEKYFSEYTRGQGAEGAIKSLGWKEFRQRLAFMYIEKKSKGEYPSNYRPSIIKDITDFEDRFQSFSLSGSGRCFLLALYLKFCFLESNSKELLIPSSLFEIVRLFNGKNQEIDILIIIVWHLIEFLGKDRLLTKLIKEKTTYRQFYEMLSDEEKQKMMKNLMHYSFSINDEQLFYKDLV